MMNPMPKSMSMKIPTPGSGGGYAKQSPIKSGPTVQQPFAGGKVIKGAKKITVPSYAHKTSNPRVKARGTSKMAQGGEKEGAASGISRTNLGRQRL